jgi:hypothetical protein
MKRNQRTTGKSQRPLLRVSSATAISQPPPGNEEKRHSIILEGTMKITLAVLTALAVLFATTSAQEMVLPSKANRSAIEKNLINGLKSENIGLQRSAALMLGKIRASDAVIPLMAVLHNSTDSGVRMAAAYALCKIGDDKGTYAVKQAVKFDDCSKVKLASAWYYEQYVKKGTFVFKPAETEMLALILDQQ